MAFDAGSVVAKFKADTSDFQEGVRKVNGEVGNMGSVFAKVGGVIAGVFAVTKIVDFGKEIAKQAGTFEQYMVSFETMLGSLEKATKLMSDLTEFAKKTPFNLEQVVQGSKQLLAYGFAQEDIITNMRMLGDVASGLSIPLGDLVYLYGTTATQGKAMTKDLYQFMNRGIPVIDLLAKKYKVTNDEIYKMTEQGKIGFTDIRDIFVGMTSEGGKFYNLMEKQSGTMLGQLSNLQDAWQQFKVTLGNLILPVVKQVVSALANLLMGLNDLIKGTGEVNGIWKVLQDTWNAVLLFLQPLTSWFVATVIPELQKIWAELFYFINEVVPPVVAIIMWLVNNIIIPVVLTLVAFWKENWTNISNILLGAWEVITNIIQVAFAVIAGIFTVALNLLTGNWQGAWDNAKRYLGIAWDGIKGIFNGIISFIKGWGGLLIGELVRPFEEAWNRIRDFVNNIKDALDFTKRHSPSVVDIVHHGVNEVNRAFEGLKWTIPVNRNAVFKTLANSTSAVNNVNINLAGAFVGDMRSATQLSEVIGDNIIKRLKMNVRF